jgi:hypothetical protein
MSSLKQRFTKCVLGLFLAFFLVPAMVLAAPFTNWSLSLDGGANSMIVPSYLTISGLGYIENTPTTSGLEFKEWAVFQALANNYGKTIQDVFPGYQLTGSLYGFGVVETNAFSFNGGSLDIYVDSPRVYSDTSNDFYGAEVGTKIASFDLVSGGGTVNADTTPSGSVDAQFVSSFLLPGYFFDPYGNDIALESYPIEWLFAMSNTTASYETGGAVSALFKAALLDTFGIIATDSVPRSFFVSNSGEFTIGVVPEPGTFILLGAGLLGLAAIGRRKIRTN